MASTKICQACGIVLSSFRVNGEYREALALTDAPPTGWWPHTAQRCLERVVAQRDAIKAQLEKMIKAQLEKMSARTKKKEVSPASGELARSTQAIFEAFAGMVDTLARNNIPCPHKIMLPRATFILLVAHPSVALINVCNNPSQGDSIVVKFPFGTIEFYNESEPIYG